MISLIGLFLTLIAGLNALWSLLLYLLYLSGIIGAKASKKIGTDNNKTDEYIEIGKSHSKKFLLSFGWRLALTIIGYLMYSLG